jgi:hypothetical protein
MDTKERSREKMEVRLTSQETLRFVLEWISNVKPSEWLPSKEKDRDDVISPDELKQQWRDYVDKASALITKAWKPAELVLDDLISFLEEVYAKPQGTSESK